MSRTLLKDFLQALDDAVGALNHTADNPMIESLNESTIGEDIQIGPLELPRESLAPREILAASNVKLRIPARMRKDTSIKLNPICANGIFEIEWCTTESPEAVSLVRTDAEQTVWKRIGR